MKHPAGIFFCFTCIVLFLCTAATAQTRPDAGILLQEQRQPGAALPDRLPADREKETIAPPMTDRGIKVLVKGFRFIGLDTIATDAELQELVKDNIGKELGFADLQEAASRVTAYLREKKGYLLARAYLPKQDITEGIVTIAIISGRIDGKVRINMEEPKRIRPSLLAGIAERSVPSGGPARMEQIERAVLLMNDLPGITARASLEPGAAPGTTRIVINADEGPVFHGLLSGDTFGDRYTGTYRGTGQVSAYDPFGLGDQMTLSSTYAEHLSQWRAAYDLPVGSTGLTVNAAYTGLTYELGKDLADLKAKGWADTLSAGISYPLVRTRNTSIWTGMGAEYMMLNDEANGEKTRDRRISTGTASVSGSFFDTFGGGGLTSASFLITGGNVDLSGLTANKENDDAGPRTQGTFMRATYSLARLQRITQRVALFGSLKGQFASYNLDSSQKFILGGPTGIRAYPVGEAPGDEGHTLTLETRYDVPFMPSWAATQLTGFIDAGWVKLHRSPWPGSVTSASGKNEYVLSGAGVGINVGKPGLYSVRASYAHKVGPNDGRSVSGNDADNLNDNGRFWLQLIIWL
ncbi:MAG: Heme/hemopexin transporter protein HuxB precursor [Syntrophorhabdus sp. PtaU1.Bin058]|nr:MAG: Heme/hemopexin transporter protein HuxB precursor [Syntrophorhabdus sp. PtaU1.Bin058]